MLDDKGPLLFINTVTNVTEGSNQEIFDSRNPIKQNDNHQIKKKLNNIIEMYHKDRPVLCNLITKNHSIKATPINIFGNSIIVKTIEGIEQEIEINNLEKIEILKF